MNILGISAFYHDSAACLVRDGEIVAAVSEERFTRKRHDADLPLNAMRYCLQTAGVAHDAIDIVVYYDKPLTTFFRLLTTYMEIAPAGFRSFHAAIPQWLRHKLWIPMKIEEGLEQLGYSRPKQLLALPHHLSHASSAFFPSPFERAAILTMDGVGEWATSSVGLGAGNRVDLLHELRFPHSLGFLYSAFTGFAGFKVNSGEYKLMGLAPYGEPKYVRRILDHLIDLRADGSFRLNLEYFGFLGGFSMTSRRFAKLFDGPPRKPETQITRREMDLARSIQAVTEEIVLRMARHARAITDARSLCLSGGVALNCVANGVLLRERVFDEMWIQPAAGDAGSALGAALYCWFHHCDQPRKPDPNDSMHGSALGPEFSDVEIESFLRENGCAYDHVPAAGWAARIADYLADEKVVGLLQGRMEFGPRALGNRSILGDARSSAMQSVMNLKIKYRESFRPFAPAVLRERAHEYFEIDSESPYMLLVAPVRSERQIAQSRHHDDLIRWVNEKRSDIPAVTHVDYSARVQTVDPNRNARFYEVIKAFNDRTGCGVLINTSFNVRGEPIVCTPRDAYRCFMRSEIDVLVLENFILEKHRQPKTTETEDWRSEFQLD
jgi:carbamoyltransferase